MYGCQLLSVVVHNAVYVTVVVNYVVQCRFLALYIESLIERIRENTIALYDTMEVMQIMDNELGDFFTDIKIPLYR